MGENVNSFLSTIFWGNQSVESGYVIRIDINSLCHHRLYVQHNLISDALLSGPRSIICPIDWDGPNMVSILKYTLSI